MRTGKILEWAHSVTIYKKNSTEMLAFDEVKPGYWIVEYGDKYFRAYPPEEFERLFEPRIVEEIRGVCHL
jgi:hypothetical protein